MKVSTKTDVGFAILLRLWIVVQKEAIVEVIQLDLVIDLRSDPLFNVNVAVDHDAALVADFDNMDAFRKYVSSDGHKAYVEDHAKHVTAKLSAIQHEM